MKASKLQERQAALLWEAQTVASMLGIGQRTLWRWIASGQFPKPDISKGAKLRRWKRETVVDWIETNQEGR